MAACTTSNPVIIIIIIIIKKGSVISRYRSTNSNCFGELKIKWDREIDGPAHQGGGGSGSDGDGESEADTSNPM